MARAPITNIDLIASATCDKELFILCKIRNIFIINIIMDTKWTPTWTPSFLLTCSGLEQDTYSSEVGSFLWSSNLWNNFCIVETVLSQNISPQSVVFLAVADWAYFLRHLSKKQSSLKSLEKCATFSLICPNFGPPKGSF